MDEPDGAQTRAATPDPADSELPGTEPPITEPSVTQMSADVSRRLSDSGRDRDGDTQSDIAPGDHTDESTTVFGKRYRVTGLLGRGGMADVYSATDQVLGRPVAVKVFRPGSDSSAARERFDAEVRTLAGLTHPNLVSLFDGGQDHGRPWCVMQYLGGGSLDDIDEPMSPRRIAGLGAEVAAALSYVHELGIVHRDVKPSNVLLDDDGLAHLADFGVSQIMDATRMTQSGALLGTAAYLSPEQVLGKPATTAVDIYALALVVLEALTGRREFPGAPVESAIARLSRQPEIPEALELPWHELLAEMTALDPAQRPDAGAVALRLRSLARHGGDQALPPHARASLGAASGESSSAPGQRVRIEQAALSADLGSPPALGLLRVHDPTTTSINGIEVGEADRQRPPDPSPRVVDRLRRHGGTVLAGAALVAASAIMVRLPNVDTTLSPVTPSAGLESSPGRSPLIERGTAGAAQRIGGTLGSPSPAPSTRARSGQLTTRVQPVSGRSATPTAGPSSLAPTSRATPSPSASPTPSPTPSPSATPSPSPSPSSSPLPSPTPTPTPTPSARPSPQPSPSASVRPSPSGKASGPGQPKGSKPKGSGNVQAVSI